MLAAVFLCLYFLLPMFLHFLASRLIRQDTLQPADIVVFVIAQAEKTLAEARKANLEADGLDIANFERKIAAVKKVADLMKEIEPDEVVGLLGRFGGR